ncbi:MAB_1171c family putative transporter [Amycolatopsis aidingensis]|uniref:MAB_1171c family putative transporter n=1 Tax=Amycolatopsis aidingensis TaxID=2842453 RepID=UPI001C0AE0A9|nr:MAB_1171c family putative transporter [Amycolatopsis aidingensis]
MFSATIQYFLIAFGTLVSLYRLRDLLRSPRQPAKWALWCGILSLTLAMTCGPNITSFLPPDANFAIQHIFILGSFLAVEVFFWLSISERGHDWRSGRWHISVLVALTIAMLLAFAVSVVLEKPDFLHLDYQHQPWALATVLLYNGGLAVAMVAIALLARRWSRIADKPWLRRGLSTLTIACWFTMVYAAHHATFVVLPALEIQPPYSTDIEIVPIALGVILGLAGVTMPAWGPRLSALRQWTRYRRSARRLEPLWAAFCAAYPDIRLPVTPPSWDAEFLLHRRVIEIWDGRSRIRHLLDPDVARRAFETGDRHGLRGDELAASVEAALWHDALQRRHHQDTASHTGHALAAPATGNNLAAAVTFLEHVAHHFAQHPTPAVDSRARVRRHDAMVEDGGHV